MKTTVTHFEVIGAKDGACPLCHGKRETELFVVRGPYTGDICGPHLHVLAKQSSTVIMAVILFAVKR